MIKQIGRGIMIDVRAFVVPPGTEERVSMLNQAVRDYAILPVQGVSGTGKDRFVDWWRLRGASSQRVTEHLRVAPEDIVPIALSRLPASSVPMCCVCFSMLWFALRVLDARLRGIQIEPNTGRLQSLSTEQQFLSLYHDRIIPMMWELQPRAIVISNAHLLDERTLHWLLHLRKFSYADRPMIAQQALILVAHEETKVAWPSKLDIAPLNNDDFQRVFIGLFAQNLNALFTSNIDQDSVLEQFAKWTQRNWWLIAEFVKILDRELGPIAREGEPRLVTPAILELVERQWMRRTQV
jgi:hypothetical protein